MNYGTTATYAMSWVEKQRFGFKGTLGPDKFPLYKCSEYGYWDPAPIVDVRKLVCTALPCVHSSRDVQ